MFDKKRTLPFAIVMYVIGFNGMDGYHLALEICGNVMLALHVGNVQVGDATPLRLFRINTGYHDDVALSPNENDNGIILNTNDLQGIRS